MTLFILANLNFFHNIIQNRPLPFRIVCGKNGFLNRQRAFS